MCKYAYNKRKFFEFIIFVSYNEKHYNYNTHVVTVKHICFKMQVSFLHHRACCTNDRFLGWKLSVHNFTHLSFLFFALILQCKIFQLYFLSCNCNSFVNYRSNARDGIVFLYHTYFFIYIIPTLYLSRHTFISGGNYESNVIFSPKSYLPRSATFNVTVELFGESVNIFEVSCLLLVIATVI